MNIKDFWFNLSDKIRFLVIGGFNALFSYVLYSIMLLFWGPEAYQVSLLLSWTLSSFVAFMLQRNLVFQSKGPIVKQYLKCCSTWVFSYLINAMFLKLLVENLSCNVYLAQLVANAAVAVFTYILFKAFAFKK